MEAAATSNGGDRAPARAKGVLLTLIGVAAVANLNLAVANVALPEIGRDLDAGQTQLNLIAVGFSLGLASSVLYLGALGDRFGRKAMMVGGIALAIPTSILAALAPSADVLVLARLLGGVAAGMAFPTTLALITALWSGAKRTKAIALWSAVGGAVLALGSTAAGILLTFLSWEWVFLVTVPIALVVLVAALKLIPSGVNETTEPVDNFGGVLSVLMVAVGVLAINFAPVPGAGTVAIVFGVAAVVAGGFFWLRQKRASNPLYDLKVAARPTFWVAAVAGIIVFGSLMGAVFVGQQYLQNVLEYSTLQAGLSVLPAAALMVVVAPRSATLVERHGARLVLLGGYALIFLGFAVMFLLWNENSPYWHIGLAFALVGMGIGLAGTPASRSLTGSVPVSRAGMASGTADLQRDLGGAIMQSILGALLTAGYAKSFADQIAAAPNSNQISDQTASELQRSYSSAIDLAERYPKYQDAIVHAAREAFLFGDDRAYLAGGIAVVIGAALVFFKYPHRARERELMAEYARE